MKVLRIIRLSILLTLVIAGSVIKAQTCGVCISTVNMNDSLTYNIFNTDTTDYTLSAGQTLCIYTTGTFKGSIINNGGTICNKGRFFPKALTLNSGTLINGKTMKLKASLTLSSSMSLLNNPGSTLTIDGDLSVSGGSVNNEGIINISNTLVNNSGTLDNMAIINCYQLSGSNTITNYEIGLVNTKN